MTPTGLPGFDRPVDNRRNQAIAVSGLAVTLVVLARLAARDFFGRNPLFHGHGYCYLWDTPLVSTHVAADVIIGASYVAISLTLAYMVYHARRDIPFSWMMLTFGAFIVACGMTHFMEVVTLWQPVFWLSADVKVITAIASVGAALLLPPLVPRIFTLIESAKMSEARRVELSQANIELERRVTERTKELEAALAREQDLRERAEVANRTKDEFLATVSHELRTPLNAILGWTDMLQRRTISGDAAAKALASVHRNAVAQATLVEDLLDISRVTAGTLKLAAEPVSLRRAASDALETVRLAAQARRVSLTAELADDPIWVTGDAHRLQQIVWNLLSNAVKFTPDHGHVILRLRREAGEARLEVSDNGIGIDPSFLPHLFERFRQADSTTSRSYTGLGLGLSLVRYLTELHGGRVEAKSDGAGRGTTFTVSIPLLRHVPVTASAAAAAQPSPPPDLLGLRVLVVDDDSDNLEMVAAALRGCGATVLTAHDGFAALSHALVAGFDVIVSDIAMPRMDGFALVKELRASGVKTPVVALTAHVRATDQERVLDAGFRRYVSKPATSAEVAWAVKSAAS